MRPNLIANHVDAPRARDSVVAGERIRLVSAVAALLASALFLTGGLLWREHDRALQRQRPSVGVVR